jgi:hypothetical protein
MFDVCPLSFNAAQNSYARCMKEKCGWWILTSGTSQEMRGECAVKNIAINLKGINDTTVKLQR